MSMEVFNFSYLFYFPFVSGAHNGSVSASEGNFTGGAILLFLLIGVTPMRRGIWCADETIRYPFKGSTIPNYALYIFGFSIPLALIIFTEVIRSRRRQGQGTFLGRATPHWLPAIYRAIIDFLFGAVASQLITDVGKYSIGRLRPNFISVCHPVSGGIDLTKNCSDFPLQYITDYLCTGSENDAAESRVSFPSGHASFSAYTMLYTALYIHGKWPKRLKLPRATIQLLLILLAYFTALSRVMDNKHHWSDVLTGGIIGVTTAIIVARYVSGLIGPHKSIENDVPKEIQTDAEAPLSVTSHRT